MAKSITPFKFEEQQRQVYHHALKIYIEGADVSPWLTAGVTVRYADRSGINSCSFSLSNTHQAFELTAKNLSGQNTSRFRAIDPYSPHGSYSELAKMKIYERKQKNQVTHEITSFFQNTSRPIKDASKAATDITSRYPFYEGSLVLHKYDRVRVFAMNPLAYNENQWVCIFSGYIENKPFSQDYVNGTSIISITCQDIRSLLQTMRTQQNPSNQTGNENTLIVNPSGKVPDKPDAGFFNDLTSNFSYFSHVLAGKDWLTSVKGLLLGVNGGSSGKVGKLSEGQTIRYNADGKVPGDTLEDWNNLIIFGSKKGWLTSAEVNTMGENTYTGGSQDLDVAKVHFLLPDKGLSVSNLIEYSVDGNVVGKIDFSSRLELLTTLCKNIDYQFYVTGYGDLVFEFPMYDFLPVDYNPIYQSIYSFNYHCVNDNINDEGGQVISALEVTSDVLFKEVAGVTTADTGSTGGIATQAQLKRTIYSNVLASRLGIHVETHYVPGVTDGNRLIQLGMVEFQKRLADFNKMDSSFEFRPFIGVNRPIYNIPKQRYGITSTVSYSYNIRENASLDVELSYIRRKESDGKFRFITGGEANPISYAKIYQNAFVPGQGVNATPGQTAKPTPSIKSEGNAGG